MSETNRRCKYCGAKLKGEYLVKQGMCFYCDNDDCKVKPITDTEIIKALEYCVNVKSCNECNKPNPRPCTVIETKDILDLFNRQKAENKEIWEERNRIYNNLEETKAEVRDYQKICSKQQAEIERLEADKEALINGQETLQKNLPIHIFWQT